MSVAVIIPARDAQATLPAALAGVSAQGVECEVIVVDDGSRQPVEAPGARVVRTDGVGPGAARNAGVRATHARLLAFTDADCVPAAGWLQAGLAALQSADLVQGQVVPDPGAARGPFDRTIEVPALSPLFETANLFVRRELFDALGGFSDGIADPRKALAEDVYFGWAARRAGARIASAPGAVVEHAVFPRSPAAFVAERARLRHFPEMVAAVPELRDAALTHRLFLSAQSRDFDLAVAGLAVAAITRRPAGLLAASPYLRRLRGAARSWPGHPPLRTAGFTAAADALGAASLLAGSVRNRTPVL